MKCLAIAIEKTFILIFSLSFLSSSLIELIVAPLVTISSTIKTFLFSKFKLFLKRKLNEFNDTKVRIVVDIDPINMM